jgi:hypothetical protein
MHPPPFPHVVGSSPLCALVFCTDYFHRRWASVAVACGCWAAGPGQRGGRGWLSSFVFQCGYLEPSHNIITNQHVFLW